MSNYNNTRPPRTGVIIFASVVFLSIFVIAVFDAYEYKAQALGHSVHLSPSSANYGTVSSAPSTIAVPMRSTAPLLSGGTIRSYAYSGHSSMPKTSGSVGGFTIHTTSSASLHSYGSGGGGAGGSMGSTGASSASRGIQNSSVGSVSVPTLALATPSFATVSAQGGGRPRYIPGYNGTYEGQEVEDEGKYWTWDGEGWIETGSVPIGTTKIDDEGKTWRWNGSAWVIVDDQAEPGLPLGDTPFLWMFLLVGIYTAIRYTYTKKATR